MKPPRKRRFLNPNPKATPGSIFRRGLLMAATMAAFYGVCAYFRFNERFQPTWWGFTLFVLVGFFGGMVSEWQEEPWGDDEEVERDE